MTFEAFRTPDLNYIIVYQKQETQKVICSDGEIMI
jgi:hypothetical protein